jgi:hypothetical protein
MHGSDPAVVVKALAFGRALLNALLFTSTDGDVVVLRCVHIVVGNDGFEDQLQVESTDRATVFAQTITCDAPVTLDVLLEQDDAKLLAQAVKSALRAAGDKELLTLRIRLVSGYAETRLRVQVGSVQVDFTPVDTGEAGPFPDVGEILRACPIPERPAPFKVLLHTTLLARLKNVKAAHRHQQGAVSITQHKTGMPIRCELPDGAVALLMCRVEQDLTHGGEQ